MISWFCSIESRTRQVCWGSVPTSHVLHCLLSTHDGKFLHDIENLTDDEMTPTFENLIIPIWLRFIHKDLPHLVQQYGTELLVQDGQPIAFGSKSLTDTQSRYSNIECEMLAIVWGIEKYHTYLYGRNFTVITDHKPMEALAKKPPHSVLPWLQRMLWCIQGYRFTIRHCRSKEIVLVDALSQLPNPGNASEILQDVRVDGICVMGTKDDEDYLNVHLINFPSEKQEILRKATTNDPALQSLMDMIRQRWPDTIKEL